MTPQVLSARIMQPMLPDSDWTAKNPVILKDEILFIEDSNGNIIGIKRGDGKKKYSELPIKSIGNNTGGGGSWNPIIDPEPLDGSVNIVNSGGLFNWAKKLVFKSGTKQLSDENFTKAHKDKLESLSNNSASSFAGISGSPLENTQLKAIFDQLQTASQVKDITMQYAYPLQSTGYVIYYDRYRIYGTREVPINSNLTDSITNSLYPVQINSSGIIYLNVGSSAMSLPTRFVKVAGDMVLNNVNIINYLYVNSNRVEYSIYPAI